MRAAARGLLAAATLAGFAYLEVAMPAAPATASSRPAPRIHSFSPRAGAAETKVTITGSGFTGVTTVRFAGATAAFRVNRARPRQ